MTTEEPRQVAFPELQEEIGTDKAQIIAESKACCRMICRQTSASAGTIVGADNNRNGS